MGAPVVLDMIEAKDKRFVYAAPTATIASICADRFVLQPVVVRQRILAPFLRVRFHPIGNPLFDCFAVRFVVIALVCPDLLDRASRMFAETVSKALAAFVASISFRAVVNLELL